MTSRERVLVVAVVAAGACAGVAIGAVKLAESRRAADDAAASLAECRRLAERLEARRGPSTMSAGAGEDGKPVGEADVIRRIESAAKSAALPDDAIERIEPMPAERLGPGPLRIKPTAVELDGVTLRQALTFLHAAAGGRSGLRLKQVRLAAPAVTDTGDTWSVESTLTQVVSGAEGGDDEDEDTGTAE